MLCDVEEGMCCVNWVNFSLGYVLRCSEFIVYFIWRECSFWFVFYFGWLLFIYECSYVIVWLCIELCVGLYNMKYMILLFNFGVWIIVFWGLVI